MTVMLRTWWLFCMVVTLCIEWSVKASGNEWVWRDLTDNELADWYSPADLCVLNTTSKTSFPQDLRAKDCHQFTRGNRRMFCGVGMGNNNYPCYGPYGSARHSFKRGIVGYTDASRKPLLEAIQKLADSNSALLLLGDSTMRQKLQALQCELTREDPRIRFNGNLFGIVPCDTLLRVYLPDKREFHVYGISLGPRATECIAKHFPDKKLSKQELDTIISTDPTMGIAFHAQRIVDYLIEETNRSVTIIANTGLWYNELSEFRQVIPGVLSWLYNVTQWKFNGYQKPLHNRVAWHETLRQHWVSVDRTGYYEQVIVDNQEAEWKSQHLDAENVSVQSFLVPHCCQSIGNQSDWRNDVVHQVLANAPQSWRSHIPILPMAEITRPLPDLHTCNPYYKHDCTHYCYMPLMYQPLWHQILNLTTDIVV